jgi:hypothetical protein
VQRVSNDRSVISFFFLFLFVLILKRVILVGTHLDARARAVPRHDASEEQLAAFYEEVNNPRHDLQLQPIFSGAYHLFQLQLQIVSDLLFERPIF